MILLQMYKRCLVVATIFEIYSSMLNVLRAINKEYKASPQ